MGDKMNIGIASDHRGYKLKQELTNFLKDIGYNIIDYGTTSTESTDYPIYAFKIGEAVRDKKIDKGILICGTGIGMSIACNKVNGVRCAKVSSKEEASLCRLHNDANVIAIKENEEDFKEIIITFLTTEFSNEEKHIRRVNMINEYNN